MMRWCFTKGVYCENATSLGNCAVTACTLVPSNITGQDQDHSAIFAYSHLNDYEITKVVDLSQDSINQIAEAVYNRFNPRNEAYWLPIVLTSIPPMKRYECSNCGHQEVQVSNYCPHCGFRMKERI